MVKVLVFKGAEKKLWEDSKEGISSALTFYKDTEKVKRGASLAAKKSIKGVIDGGIIAAEIEEDLLVSAGGKALSYAELVKIEFPVIDKLETYLRIPSYKIPISSKAFISLVDQRIKNVEEWRTNKKPVVESMFKIFDLEITKTMAQELIKDFWKGDLAAQKENIQKLGSEVINIGTPNPKVLEGSVLLKLEPISEWNSALSSHINSSLEAAIRDGASSSELADIIRKKTPEILTSEKITIQREGKRAVTISTKDYTELLARTIPFEVRNAGYIDRMKQFGDIYAGWKSICPDDERSCEECVEKMKESEKKPFSWGDMVPPYHPNCFLPGTYCIPPGVIINGMKSFYEGPVVELTFSNGARLTITPNHLILTPYGFAPAYLLAKGDKVLYSSGFKGAIPLDPNNNGKITTIDKIFDSLLKSSGVITRTMSSSTEYFHGDAKFIKEYIDIVWTNGLLRSTFDTISCKAGNAFRFDLGYNSLGFDSLSSFTESFKTLRSIFLSSVSGISEPDPFFLRRLPHSSEHSFASVSDLNILREKLSFDNISRTREAVSQFFNRHSGVIETNEIINVDIISYHGYVYDLETTSSFLICNGVIASNCRCRPLAVMAEEEGKGKDI